MKTKRLEGEMTRLTVHLDESDSFAHEPLYKHILDICVKNNVSGATVTKGIAGFGCRHELHTDRFLRLSSELPVIIEIIDDEDKIGAILPEIEEAMKGGMITIEPVRTIKIIHAGSSE